MRCLQVDVGNSGAKWRLLDGDLVRARGRLVPDDGESREALLSCAEAVDEIWVASVGTDAEDAELAALLKKRWGRTAVFPVTPARCAGLVNSYSEPERMGIDRWLAMLGARARRSGRVCVVDVGSALTIDLVAEDGEHEGGYILPGPSLMEEALLRGTHRVRYEDTRAGSLGPGSSTAEAVAHGVALALVAAVERAVALAAKQGTQPALIVTGGGAGALSEMLETGHELVPDLVFEGLSVMAAASA